MNQLKVTLRIEKETARISLFYYDDHKDLVCFNPYEGHSAASLNYYITETLPAHIHADAEDYRRAVEYYKKNYKDGEIEIKILKRLPR